MYYRKAQGNPVRQFDSGMIFSRLKRTTKLHTSVSFQLSKKSEDKFNSNDLFHLKMKAALAELTLALNGETSSLQYLC